MYGRQCQGMEICNYRYVAMNWEKIEGPLLQYWKRVIFKKIFLLPKGAETSSTST